MKMTVPDILRNRFRGEAYRSAHLREHLMGTAAAL